MKVKLSDICDIIKGKTTITKAIEGEYPLVVTGENRLSNNEFQFDCSAVCVPLVSATGHGHASIKRIHYQEGKFALGSILAAVIPKSTNEVNPRYLHIYLSYFKDSVLVPLMRGSANVSLTIKSLGSAEIELPSINKQLEIVRVISKVEEMKNEMDKYIVNQELILSNIRRAILQDAVQGKLVSQDPNDEPAEVILAKIRKEKEKLIKEKKIKKEKPLAEISKEEEPWVLHDGWSYVRMNDICKLITDGTHSTPKYVEKGIPFISVKDISKGVIDFSDTRFITQEEHNDLIKRCNPEFGDILLTKIGTTGIAKVIDIEKEFSIFVSVALLKVFNKYIYNRYIEYVINSPFVKRQSEENTQGVGNKNLVLKCIKNFVIPIPPLEEQKRIVDKVDSLMKLCDELQNKIERQRDYSNRLMESILKSSF